MNQSSEKSRSTTEVQYQIKNALLLCFFFSGVAGLIYEVVWIRMLTLVFGATVFAVSAVLTAFMAGLALGSFYGGRLIDRSKNPLLVFGWLEAGIGIYCLFIPLFIKGSEGIYISLYQNLHTSFYVFSLIRFVVCFAILLIPTTLMGATLPVLSRFYVSRFEGLGWGVGSLYSINTFGAVLGAFATGFYLIPRIGVRATVYTGVSLNLLIAAVVLGLVFARRKVYPVEDIGKHVPVPASENNENVSHQGPSYSSFILVLTLVGFGLSGFVALVYEIAWARVLVLVFGNSVYAFSTMLTTFLAGLAIGGFIYARFIDRMKNPLLVFASIEIFIGFFALLSFFAFNKLSFLFRGMFAVFMASGRSFEFFQFAQFFICFLLMLGPTIFLGGAFPVVSKIYAQSMRRLGRSIGNVYASNTLGAIIGSFAAGFILIPLVGIQTTILLMVVVNVLLGAVLLFCNPAIKPGMRAFWTMGLVTVVFLLCLAIPKWDRQILTSWDYDGPIVFLGRGLKGWAPEKKFVYYKEGISSTVSVSKEGQDLILQIDGKSDASTYAGDMLTQVMLAHIPLLVHKNPREVLVIGLGSGVTLGSVLRHPVSKADCVEISPEVAEAARYFDRWHYRALDDPRANLIIDDGRNYVMATNKKYDVIISEPSNPWVTGVSNLFTREHYLRCKERLKEGGLMCQWFHYYSMSPETLKIAIKTFKSVFPHTSLWDLDGDILFVGTEKRLQIDYEALRRKLKNKRIRNDLAREKVKKETFLGIMGLYMLGEENIPDYVGKVPVNTDNNPIIEFLAPRSRYLDKREEIRTSMFFFKRNFSDYPVINLVRSQKGRDIYDFIGLKIDLPQGWRRESIGMLRATPTTARECEDLRDMTCFGQLVYISDAGKIKVLASHMEERDEKKVKSTFKKKVSQRWKAMGKDEVSGRKALWWVVDTPDKKTLIYITFYSPQNHLQYIITAHLPQTELCRNQLRLLLKAFALVPQG